MLAFVLLVLACIASNSLTNAYDEKRLTKSLLKNYSRVGIKGRPVSNTSEALLVKFGISLQTILKINPEEQTITNVVWYNMEWTDELLKWKPSEFGGIDSIRISPDSIYIPDIIPYNGIPGSTMTTTDVVVYPSGKCIWVPPVTLTTTCGMEDNPRNITCSIKFGSWTFDGSKVNLTNMADRVDTSTYSDNPKWELEQADAIRHVMIYECCPEPYIDITYNLHLVRKSLEQK